MNTRIQQIRKTAKMTQDEFAEKIGVSKNYVWMIEKGERVPSDRTVKDICREFKIPLHRVMYRKQIIKNLNIAMI